jgi:hypothetical protein
MTPIDILREALKNIARRKWERELDFEWDRKDHRFHAHDHHGRHDHFNCPACIAESALAEADFQERLSAIGGAS